MRLDGPTRKDLISLIDAALVEDLAGGIDATTQSLFQKPIAGSASFVSRGEGVMCGIAVIEQVLKQVASGLQLEVFVADGERLKPKTSIARLEGDAREILLVERTCLNFMGRLCGIATLTARFVEALAGTQAALFDTRKTMPGWRRLEKYAVRCGGGHNHRMGLYDAILIKDNHLAMLSVSEPRCDDVVGLAIERARAWMKENAGALPLGMETPLQIEVDSLEQLQRALSHRPSMILLDNMNVEQLDRAVALRNAVDATIELEASGGVNLESIGAIARTGVDRISVGAVTHSSTNFDVGLDWDVADTHAS